MRDEQFEMRLVIPKRTGQKPSENLKKQHCFRIIMTSHFMESTRYLQPTKGSVGCFRQPMTCVTYRPKILIYTHGIGNRSILNGMPGHLQQLMKVLLTWLLIRSKIRRLG